MEWADAEIWRAVSAHAPATQDVRTKALLTHLHLVQRMFLMLWTKQPFDPAGRPPEFATLGDLRSWVQRYYSEVHRFLDGLPASRLTEVVDMPWVRALETQLGRPLSMPALVDTIQQVASHSTYHRGQINVRLRELGGHPPLVDYVAWVWFGRPAPDWRPTAGAS